MEGTDGVELRAYFIDVWGPAPTDRDVMDRTGSDADGQAIVFAKNRRDANDLAYFYANLRDCKERGLKQMEYGVVHLDIAEYGGPEGIVITDTQGTMSLSDARMEEVRGISSLSRPLSTNEAPPRGCRLCSARLERRDAEITGQRETLLEALCFVLSEDVVNEAVVQAADAAGIYDSSTEICAVFVEQVPGTTIVWNPTCQYVQLRSGKAGCPWPVTGSDTRLG